MVSTKVEKSYLTWKPVNRPFPKPKPVSAFRSGPPPPPPRPGGKVYVYVYEAPKNPYSKRSVNYTGSGIVSSQQSAGDSLPATVDNSDSFNPNNLNELSNDTISKLKRQAKKAGEGYKVLADVGDRNQGVSSRGGRMFMKQQRRMEKFTSTSSDGLGLDEEYLDQENFNSRAFPLHNNLTRNRRNQRHILPQLRSPPPEWRAKVEANYRIDRDEHPYAKRNWNPCNSKRSFYYIRSESAPPPRLETQASTGSLVDIDDRQSAGSMAGTKSETENDLNATIHFDARKHQSLRRNRRMPERRNIFITTPHVENDFNVRAVGWSRAYAKYY